MSTVISQLNIPQPTQIIFSTLNRQPNQEKHSQKDIDKQIKKINKMVIFSKLFQITQNAIDTVKSTFDLIYRNITMYFFEDMDQKKIEVIATPLTKFMTSLTCEQEKQLLLVDNFSIFKSMSTFDLHYLTQTFKQGFVFVVSNSSDTARMLNEMRQFVQLNISQVISDNREQFVKNKKTKVIDMNKFLAFYDNYGSVYNKFFLLMFSSINDLTLVEQFVENDKNLKYMQNLVFELNQYRYRYTKDIPAFVSSCILPIINIETEHGGKTLSISTIFGFEKLLDIYLDNRKSVDLTEYSNEDGMKFIFNIITKMFNQIHKSKCLVKMPKQALPILLIWYKKMKSEKYPQLFNFMPAVYGIDKDITHECDETAICKIFNIQSLDTLSQKRKKFIDVSAYNKFIQKQSISYDDADLLLKNLGQRSSGRLSTKEFEIDYNEKELKSVFCMSRTKMMKENVIVNETFPTNYDSSSSEEEMKIKNVNSVNVNDDSSDSDSDSDNGLIAMMRKKRIQKSERDSTLSKRSSLSGKSSITLKRDLDSEIDEDVEKNKCSDRSTTPSEDEDDNDALNSKEEQHIIDLKKEQHIIDLNTNAKEEQHIIDLNAGNLENNAQQVIEHTEPDRDNGVSEKDMDVKVKGQVIHDGSCFYGSVAFHINEDVRVLMRQLRDKLNDKSFVKQVDDLLEDNKCVMRLSGNEHIILETLIPNADGTYAYASNLSFPAMSVLVQRNIVVVVRNNMFLDQTSRFSEVLFIHGDGQIAFDPIENIDVTSYRKLNWDGQEVIIDDDDDIINIEGDKSDSDEGETDEETINVKTSSTNDSASEKSTMDALSVSDTSKPTDASNVDTGEEAKENKRQLSIDDTTITQECTIDCVDNIHDKGELDNDAKHDNSSGSETSEDESPALKAAWLIGECQTKVQEEMSHSALDAVQKITEDNKLLADELCNLEMAHKTMLIENENLSTKVNQFQYSIADMRKTIAEQYDRIDRLERDGKLQKEMYDADLLKKDNEIKTLQMNLNKQELEALNALDTLEKVNRELKNKDASIAAQDKRIADKDAYITKLHSDKAELVDEKRAVLKDLSDQKEKTKILNNKINDITSELEGANDQIRILTKSLEDAKAKACDSEIQKREEKINAMRKQNLELKDQITAKDAKIIDMNKILKEKESEIITLRNKYDILKKEKKIEKCDYVQPEPLKKYNQYEGAMYDHIITQVRLFNEKKEKKLSLSKYYQVCDTSLVIGQNADENCLILYSNQFECTANSSDGNYVIVNKRCPCGGHKTVDEWISLGYIIDNRYDISLSTSYVCGCMMKPASIDDLLLFQASFPLYRHAVSGLLSKYM